MTGSDRFDVVIVGAGAAGCVVARRLADTGKHIVLLEAGPDLRSATPPAMRDGWNLPQIPDWASIRSPQLGVPRRSCVVAASSVGRPG